jgi:hypothetical protein
MGALLFVSAWSANRSGRIRLQWDVTDRETQPRLFVLTLVMRLVLGAFAVALAAALAAGLLP